MCHPVCETYHVPGQQLQTSAPLEIPAEKEAQVGLEGLDNLIKVQREREKRLVSVKGI